MGSVKKYHPGISIHELRQDIFNLMTKTHFTLFRRYMPSYNRPRPTARYSSFMRMVNRGSVHLEQVRYKLSARKGGRGYEIVGSSDLGGLQA